MIGLDRPTLDRDLISLGVPYQWVFIDGAAKLEKMIAAAVKAADLVRITIQPSPLDIWACDPLVEMIQARQTVTDGSPAAAFVVTRAKTGTLLAREVADAIKTYGFPILQGSIYNEARLNSSDAPITDNVRFAGSESSLLKVSCSLLHSMCTLRLVRVCIRWRRSSMGPGPQ